MDTIIYEIGITKVSKIASIINSKIKGKVRVHFECKHDEMVIDITTRELGTYRLRQGGSFYMTSDEIADKACWAYRKAVLEKFFK